MATAKAPNYSPEQTAQIVADYQAGVSVEQIAEKVGKTSSENHQCQTRHNLISTQHHSEESVNTCKQCTQNDSHDTAQPDVPGAIGHQE